MQIERAFLSALPTEPLYGFSHAVVPSTQQKATCVYRAPARHSRNPHAKYSALPNVSNAMWAGQTLLCLIVPPSGKMGTICASLPLNRYKPMHFSAQGRTIITQKPRSKRHGRPFVFVLFHRRERANKGSGPGAPSSPSCSSGCPTADSHRSVQRAVLPASGGLGQAGCEALWSHPCGSV